jgi:tetratricopeptide (TPR) repeat protein
MLFQIDTLSLKREKKLIIEYYYRLARVSQALNEDYFEVIKKFKKVLSINNNDNLYFHPMSNLQIALLYEQNGNKNKAQEFFRKTLEYKGFNYSNGIHQVATSGLSRLTELPN